MQIKRKTDILSVPFFIKADNDNTLSVLRHIAFSVNDLEEYFVVQLPQRFLDNLKSSAFVMTAKIFDILQHKCFRTLCFQDAAYIKEKCSLGLVLKPGSTPQAVFL